MRQKYHINFFNEINGKIRTGPGFGGCEDVASHKKTGKIGESLYNIQMVNAIFNKSVVVILMFAFVLGATSMSLAMRDSKAAMAKDMMANTGAQIAVAASSELDTQAMFGCVSKSQCQAVMVSGAMCGLCAPGGSLKISGPDLAETQAVRAAFLLMMAKSTAISLLKPPRA